MSTEIQDYRLQQYLQRSIENLPLNMQIQLKNLKLCGKGIIEPGNGFQAGAFVLSNGSQAKIFGRTMCKNRWACPVCTARVMARTASDIHAAIEACKELGLSATMITFTMPHTRNMRFWHLNEIMVNAWAQMTYRVNVKTPFHQFKNACQVAHHVKIAEVTYGDAGWHLHYHCLFWVPNQLLQKVSTFEESLRERWRHCLQLEMTKFYEKNPEETAFKGGRIDNAYIERLFAQSDWVKHPGVFISKTDSGKVRAEQSSSYISGWGADCELTASNEKVASKGHWTPRQLLIMARDNKDEFAFYKYIEFCCDIARKHTRRISWSIHSGIKQIIAKWKKEHGEVFAVEKKTTPEKFKVVCWFLPEQWYRICDKNRNSERQIIADILELATMEQPFLKILKYLEDLNILPRSPCENISVQCVEKIYNHVA